MAVMTLTELDNILADLGGSTQLKASGGKSAAEWAAAWGCSVVKARKKLGECKARGLITVTRQPYETIIGQINYLPHYSFNGPLKTTKKSCKRP